MLTWECDQVIPERGGIVMSWLVVGSALWLGILTSISPCPLATNVAAISFIGRRVGNTRQVLLSGLLYTIGRAAAYLALGVVVMAGLMASGDISRFLLKYLNQILGPVLILVGMLLLGILGFTASLSLAGSGVQERASRGSVWWALILGVLFALSFCPVSAGLFFGGLIPLSTSSESRFVLPALRRRYGFAGDRFRFPCGVRLPVRRQGFQPPDPG